MSETYEKLVSIMCDILDTISPDDITLDATIEDLEIDSIDFLDISYDIDKQFGIKMPVAEWVSEINNGEAKTEDYFSIRALIANIEKLANEEVSQAEAS